MTFSNDWSVTDNPADHSKFKDIPASVRKVRTDIAERLTNLIAGFATGETADGFKKLLLNELASDASAPTDAIALYGKVSGSYCELFLRHENAGVQQITVLGKINAANLGIASQAEGDILYHNGTDFVRLAKGTASQVLTMNPGATAPEWATSSSYTPPAGAIQMWGGALASPPSGWLVCDGSAVSRETYSALFAVVGTIYGSGDGSTTFNLPNFTNKFPYGANEGSSAGNASVGSTQTDGTFSGNDSTLEYNTTDSQVGNADSGSINAQNLTNNTNVMPPYLAVGFIIKT